MQDLIVFSVKIRGNDCFLWRYMLRERFLIDSWASGLLMVLFLFLGGWVIWYNDCHCFDLRLPLRPNDLFDCEDLFDPLAYRRRRK